MNDKQGSPLPGLWTIGQVASYLGCSHRKVAMLVAKKAIDSIKIGKNRRIRPEAVDKFIRGCELGEAATA